MIGIFDSGVGGLTVLRQVRRFLPNSPVLYLADTANVPYGDKPVPVVRALALALTAHLIDAGADIVIMASGTSTVAGLNAARAKFPQIPIVGTIDGGARATVAVSGEIGVLATNATARSLAFTRAIQARDAARTVVEIGCPRFVPLVESNRALSPDAEDAAVEYLTPLAAADVRAIVLGCTHFPFLLPTLRRACKRFSDFSPQFIDPAEEAVREAMRFLPSSSERRSEDGAVAFAATGDPEEFARHASALLGETVPRVARLTLNVSALS